MSNPNDSTTPAAEADAPEHLDFIREIVQQDLASGKHPSVLTRFPPEPNGYLHVGHAKSICLNFGIARQFGGHCNLRMDDTNPAKEDVEYVDSITADVQWLIDGWADQCLALKPSGAAFYASDYFGALSEFAVRLIELGKAYVCDLSPADMETYRGSPDKPGKDSPFRTRPVAESLDLFARMKAGEFPDGARTLRARIDMSSPNIWLRDPVLYRIRHTEHHQTGAAWCIYPMYDFAHGLSDYVEGITHSICTLEFEVHRPLYDWILESLDLKKALPHQYEFARLNLTHTVMSKRKLLRLVQEGFVGGWDDPRMPTIAGMRRRGYPAEAIRAFCERIGIAKRENMVELALLEHFVREHLNRHAARAMAVLKPIKVVIENWPADRVDQLEAVNNPEDLAAGKRQLPFSREIYIEQDDFREVPPPKYHRLSPGVEVRLRYAHLIRCTEVIKDPVSGEVTELRATYDAESGTGNPVDGRKVKATIHWVSAPHAVDAEVRLYSPLFKAEHPDELPEGTDFTTGLNPDSLEVLKGCKLEPSLANPALGTPVQFERLGYFCADREDSRSGAPVFDRTVTLKDAWARIEKQQGKGS